MHLHLTYLIWQIWKVKQDVQHNNGGIDWKPVWYNIYLFFSLYAVLFCTTSGAEITRFTFKNIFTQQFCCYFWILQWITMQVIPSLSVFLLACLLLFLCVSVPFWECLSCSASYSLSQTLSFLKRENFMHAYRSCSFLGGLEYIFQRILI